MQLKKSNILKVTGTTHLVEPKHDSIFEGTMRRLLKSGETLEARGGPVYLSRRGPNQEDYSFVDKVGNHQYNWLPVSDSQSPKLKHLYVRADTIEGHTEANTQKLQNENSSLSKTYKNKIDNLKFYDKPPKLLMLESGLSFIAAALKLAVGIAAIIVAALNVVVGQFLGASAAFAIGVLKWMRSSSMEKQGALIKELIAHYTSLLGINPKGPASGKSTRKENLTPEVADKKESEIITLKNTINKHRLREAGVGIFGNIGSILSGSLIGLAGFVPQFIKLYRSVQQYRGNMDGKSAGRWTMLEAFLSGLIGLLNLDIENGITNTGKALNGQKIPIIDPGSLSVEEMIAAELSADELGNIKDKTEVGSISGGTALITAGTKLRRGHVTNNADVHTSHKEKLKRTKRKRRAALYKLKGDAKKLRKKALEKIDLN